MNSNHRPADRQMSDDSVSTAARVAAKWRSWLVIGLVLLAVHAASAWHYAARFQRGLAAPGSKVLTLDSTPEEWSKGTFGCDSSVYLRAALNVAAGKGLTIPDVGSGSPHDGPFFYWGPGAPWVFGNWLRLTGGHTMWTFFWFSVLAQLIFTLLAIATAALWTRSTVALAIVAACTGFCPPLQEWYYSSSLTCSEIVSLVPLSAAIYALARGFTTYQQAAGRFWGIALRWRVGLWFGLAGLLIGLNSLVRDSCEVLGTFTAVFLIVRALLVDRRRLVLAACSAGVLLACVTAVRYPVKLWNYRRIGVRVVSVSGDGLIWRHDLWQPHDGWYSKSGVGLGEYLDSAAAARVEAYYLAKKPYPALYSFGQLAQAVWRRPGDALAFKAVRLPILWLGTTEMWPTVQWGLDQTWCIFFYGSFLVFWAIQYRRGRRIPEVLYLYFALMVCASAVIHYEFRYTFPIWNTLVLAPGLLAATLGRNDWRAQGLDRRTAEMACSDSTVSSTASQAA